MDFSALMAALQPRQGVGTVTVPSDWLQGRSLFGGLQAALLVKAMRDVVSADVPLRTLQVTFVAPVPADVTLSVEAVLLRQGKSAAQVEARIRVDGVTLCLAVGVFGAARESQVRLRPTQPPATGSRGPEAPFIQGVTPTFLQHFSLRWISGGVPFSGAASADAVMLLGHRDRTPMRELHVVALADTPPPAAISLLKRPAPGSSLTWTLEFLTDRLDGYASTGWRFDLSMTAAADGYTQQTATLWSPTGEAVALSRQTTVVFA